MNVEALEHRAAKVSLVNGVSTILGIAFQLISVPVCLHFWGKEEYGSWLALFSAFMLLRGLDGGYGAYVGNKLNYLYHRDPAALREHLSSAVYGIVIISTLQLAIAVGALAFEPLSRMLGIPANHVESLQAKLGLLALMASWVLTGSYLGIVHRLQIPAGLMYQAAWWAMVFQICQFASIMAAAMLRLNMLQTSLLFALSQIVVYVASAGYVRRALPHFSPWLMGAKGRVGVGDLGHSLFLTTSTLIQQSATNGSVLLVSALAGPVAVPMFTTVRSLTNLWVAVTTILSTPLLPDVVRVHANGETRKLLSINRTYWALVGSAVNLGAILTYPLIAFLYGQWTSHTVPLNHALLCLLLGSVVVANAGALIALHLNGINSLRIVLGASVARGVLGLGGGAVGFKYYGLASFGLGILAGELVATLMTVRYFVKHEVSAKTLALPVSDYGPIVVSTGAVLLFFVGAAFDWWATGWAWCLAIVAAAIASVWGWKGLEPELHSRLRAVPTKLFGF